MRRVNQRATIDDAPKCYDLNDLPSTDGDFPKSGMDSHRAVRDQWRWVHQPVV